jgi:hypothetical protein
MPRKRNRSQDDDVETMVKTVEVDPQDAKVRKIFAAMPGGLKCLSVFRYPDGNKGGRPQYLDDISPEQFDFKTIKSMFGGGRFYVRWDNEDGTESKSNFDIAGPYVNFNHDDDDEPEKTIDVNPQPFQPQPVQTVQQGIDPLMMMKLIQDARKEAREEMRTMMEFMRPPAPAPDATKQVFDLVEKIVPLIQSGGDGGSPWLAVLSQFREPISKIVDSVQVALSRQAVPHSGPPPVQAQVQANPSPTQPSEDDMIKLLIRQYLPVFINAARSNGNPEVYADMILDQVPESLYPKLEAWLSTPAWFTDIVAIEKNVEFQAGWWNLLRVAILEGLQPNASSVQPAPNSELSED